MNVLLITFSFPPAGGVGVLRALSLAKYLPESKVRVDVLTARNAPAVGRDEQLVMSAVGPEPLLGMGLTPCEMQAIALEKFPRRRWLAKRVRSTEPGVEHLPKGVHLYAPMTAQLTRAGDASLLTLPEN